ncbi:porin family protein [Sphingomonas sp. R-74633]|uniref:outer membrane protein n=1 Tax=Sphingomonas sp. R-74633 TaxID=2751188 RepID=UPI0015D2D4B6|nr:porin family protein [Sphingomonas sp. R-74633]NYT40250.1 porin family protein [Sphingomonas sp. R-74633]
MRKAILILAATTCLVGANTAFAQEADKTPAQAFAGPRAEVTVGLDQSGDDTFSGTELTGMRVGGAVGYDVALGKRVTLGVEAGIGWMVAGHANIGPFPPSDPRTYKISAGRDSDVSARIGYALSPKTLIFAKAGWAEQSYSARSSEGGDFGDRKSNGVRVGAGLEQKLTSNVYAKAEYRYTSYSDVGNLKNDRHQLLTGIGVRF